MKKLYKKKVKKVSVLTQNFCRLANEHEVMEVIEWGDGLGYYIIISEHIQSVMLSVSKDHFALIKEMIEELDK